MNPSDLVVPLDLAKRLKDAGFPQTSWFFYERVTDQTDAGMRLVIGAPSSIDGRVDSYAAPTTDELLAELPDEINHDYSDFWWFVENWSKTSRFKVGYHTDNQGEVSDLVFFCDDCLPSALAELWLWWREWSKKDERN